MVIIISSKVVKYKSKITDGKWDGDHDYDTNIMISGFMVLHTKFLQAIFDKNWLKTFNFGRNSMIYKAAHTD